MKKDETIIQDEIITHLKNRQVLHWRMSGASNLAGFPDLLVCYRGEFVAFEIKTPVGRATMQQLKVITDITGAGGWATLVCSVSEVEKTLSAIDRYLDDVLR